MRVWLAWMALFAGCATEDVVDPDFPDGYPDGSMPGKADHSAVTQIPYRGGVVLHHPSELNVYWGGYWATAKGQDDRVLFDAFASSAGASSWYDHVLPYADTNAAPGRSIAAPPVVLDDKTLQPAPTVSDRAIRSFLSARFADGTLEYDPQTIYMVFAPPHVTVSTPWGKSCEELCGYHYHYDGTTTGAAKHDIIYAVIPYLSCGGCSAGVHVHGTSLDAITVTLSHELAETVTDPNCDAWETRRGNDEVGDLCDTGTTAHWNGRDFAVQDLWSNQAKRCLH